MFYIYFEFLTLFLSFLNIVGLRELYIRRGLDIAVFPTEHLPPIEPSYITWNHTKVLTNREITCHLQALKKACPLAVSIYATLKDFGILGASFDHLKQKFLETNPNTRTQDIFTAFSNLVNHEPPLAKLVGFEKLRYVGAYYFQFWLLKNSKGDYCDPLVWCDISGNVMKKTLDGCSEVVLSHIIKRPGIEYVR
jgi:hypothetical protein